MVTRWKILLIGLPLLVLAAGITVWLFRKSSEPGPDDVKDRARKEKLEIKEWNFVEGTAKKLKLNREREDLGGQFPRPGDPVTGALPRRTAAVCPSPLTTGTAPSAPFSNASTGRSANGPGRTTPATPMPACPRTSSAYVSETEPSRCHLAPRAGRSRPSPWPV